MLFNARTGVRVCVQARTFLRVGKVDEAGALYEAMSKRFGTSKKVWSAWSGHLYEQGQVEAARAVHVL